MTMMDGDSKAAQEIKATVDPVAVAQLVRQMQQADAAAQQKKESRFQAKIKSLIDSGNVDKDNLKEIEALQLAAMADLKDELQNESGKGNVQSMQARYNDAVSDALDKYIADDEQLEDVADMLQQRTLKKLGADPDVMSKFNAGQLDKRQVNNIAKEVVEDFSKKVLKRDKSSKGVTINQAVPGAVASKALENTAAPDNIDDITEPHRRQAYFKLNALFKRNKIDPAEAHKKAYAAATRQYKKQGSAA